MDIKKYKINGIVFEIILNSNIYKIADIFNEPQPYNLYINYHIIECNEETDEKIIINDSNDTNVEIIENGIVINTNIEKIIKKDYNHQFSLFGNKGVVQKYILHVIETKYKSLIFHGCALKNSNNEIIIGLGGSGSGKSVLINTALQKGWELISTEQTQVSEDMYIIKSNIFDNVSPLSEQLVKEKLPMAVVLEEKRLIEPIGQKVFVDLTQYQTKEDRIKIDISKLTIVNVNFNGKGESIVDIEDKDYLLRLLQISASDKISSPAIIRNDLINFQSNGDAKLRQSIINKLISSDSKKIILSNGFNGFNLFFDRKGGI